MGIKKIRQENILEVYMDHKKLRRYRDVLKKSEKIQGSKETRDKD